MLSILERDSTEEAESGESDNNFQWIDCSHPSNVKSAKNRHIIHRHSMRDVGKARRKRPKRQGRARIPLDISALEAFKELKGIREAQEILIRPSWWLGTAAGMDPFIKYPVELDSAATELIAVVFQDDGGLQRALRDAWFAVGLSDEAAFMQVLSNSALHLHTLRNGGRKPQESPLSVYYQLRAVRYINDRRQDSETFLNDGSIGAVSALMCHDDIIGAFDRWANHHRGVIDMVALRGGIETFDRNETLRITISWVELRGSYPQDLEPFFPSPHQWVDQATLPSLPPSELLHSNTLRRIWSGEMPGQPQWLRIYESLVLFSLDSFPSPLPGATLDHPQTGAWTNHIIHRLLKFRPLRQYDIFNRSLIQEACRLGSLLYLAPVWRMFGVHPVRTDLLVGKLRDLLEAHEMDWFRLWKLRLWVLYMGAMEARSLDGSNCFAREIAKVLLEQGIWKWSEVIACVKEILWIEIIFAGKDEMLRAEVESLLEDVE